MKEIMLCFVLLISNIIFCSVHYISNSGNDLNDGLNWDNSFATIEKGLASSNPGDEIWVSKGTYYPNSSYDLTDSPRYYHLRLKNGIRLLGGFSGDEIYGDYDISNRDFLINETIISGNIGSPDDSLDNCYHIFYHPDSLALDSTAVINGFTISGGNADGTEYAHKFGGGFSNSGCSPSLVNMAIKNNFANDGGGGIFNDCCEKTAYLDCCIISGNISSGQVGGIYSYSTKLIVTNSSVTENTSGLYLSGESLSDFENCEISRNISFGVLNSDGSVLNMSYSEISSNGNTGIHNITYSEAYLKSCRIDNNNKYYSSGGFNNLLSSVEMINCIVSNNTSSANGGGIYTDEGIVNLINCDIVSNVITGQNSKGGGIYGINSLINIDNSILWGNQATGWSMPTYGGIQLYYTPGTGSYDRVYIDNSCFLSDSYNFTAVGEGSCNISSDPEFFDPENGDFRLKETSPCLDTGNNNLINEEFDIRGYGFERKLNSYDGLPGIVDIGAYEFKLGYDSVLDSPSDPNIVYNSNTAFLTWSPVPGANCYTIYRSADPIIGFVKLGSTTDCSYSDSAIPEGNKSFYYIKAENVIY
ncbi:MAG TPA: right-handed parallel beta-helix repeat-containing protein [Clostridiales bacterium]|nr:right-handed parallel beta-helix repeat-containing protein [Clostridiales bacterium]